MPALVRVVAHPRCAQQRIVELVRAARRSPRCAACAITTSARVRNLGRDRLDVLRRRRGILRAGDRERRARRSRRARRAGRTRAGARSSARMSRGGVATNISRKRCTSPNAGVNQRGSTASAIASIPSARDERDALVPQLRRRRSAPTCTRARADRAARARRARAASRPRRRAKGRRRRTARSCVEQPEHVAARDRATSRTSIDRLDRRARMVERARRRSRASAAEPAAPTSPLVEPSEPARGRRCSRAVEARARGRRTRPPSRGSPPARARPARTAPASESVSASHVRAHPRRRRPRGPRASRAATHAAPPV